MSANPTANAPLVFFPKTLRPSSRPRGRGSVPRRALPVVKGVIPTRASVAGARLSVAGTLRVNGVLVGIVVRAVRGVAGVVLPPLLSSIPAPPPPATPPGAPLTIARALAARLLGVLRYPGNGVI